MSVRTNAGFLDSVPVGCGMDWFTDTAPDNWMLCQGQAISRTDYAELFAVIGTTYGAGNGSTTFNIPDFRGRTGVGKAASGTFASLGTKTGNETFTITANNLPPYVQDATFNTNSNADLTLPSGGTVLTSVAKTTKGKSTPDAISKVQPSLVQNKIIKVK